MMARIVRRRPAQIVRFLRSTEMQRAVIRIAEELAARVAAAPSGPYARMPTPHVMSTPMGGRRGDRAQATVIVPAPAPADVRFPDVQGRFRSVQNAVRQVIR